MRSKPTHLTLMRDRPPQRLGHVTDRSSNSVPTETTWDRHHNNMFCLNISSFCCHTGVLTSQTYISAHSRVGLPGTSCFLSHHSQLLLSSWIGDHNLNPNRANDTRGLSANAPQSNDSWFYRNINVKLLWKLLGLCVSGPQSAPALICTLGYAHRGSKCD